MLGVTLPSSEWQRIVREAPRIPSLPAGMPVLVPSAEGIPSGETPIAVACPSDDADIVCIPRFEHRMPGGLTVVGCDCIRVGVDEDNGPGITVRPVTFPTRSCRSRISQRTIAGEGTCPQASQTCRFNLALKRGLTCLCTP